MKRLSYDSRFELFKRGEKMNKTVWFVIPCYNEQEVIDETTKRLKVYLKELTDEKIISEKSRVLYVDDGSKDSTWSKIKNINAGDKRFLGIKLSHNKGHQNALLAGLMYAKNYCDAVISMDADLQDDIYASKEMILKHYEGNEIVFGVRNSRKTDSVFKRTSAKLFYKIMNTLGAEVVYNHADYRLMGQMALSSLSEYKEVNLFLRGIVAELGFKSAIVYYERGKRFAGKSKYPLKKMLSFATEGVTSFSVKPIKFAVFLGTLSFLVSVAMLIYCIYQKIAGHTVPGWSSLGVSIWAVGGMQLFMIGVIGEYIGKIYLETKNRPRYTIEEITDNEI